MLGGARRRPGGGGGAAQRHGDRAGIPRGSQGWGWRLAHSVAVTAFRRRLVTIVGIALVAVALLGVFVAGKAAGLDRLGTPVHEVTTDAPPPAPLGGTNGWAVKADGRPPEA